MAITQRVALYTSDPDLTQSLRVAVEPLGFTIEQRGYYCALVCERADEVCRVIVDWVVADRAGLEVCRDLRLRSSLRDVPILVLVGSNSISDKLDAMSAGANRIVIRTGKLGTVAMQLRRFVEGHGETGCRGDPIAMGDIEFDVANQIARRCGRILDLAPSELLLLQYFLCSKGSLVSRAELTEWLRSSGADVSERSINMYVVRLRKALSRVRQSDPIQTVRGRGYQLVI